MSELMFPLFFFKFLFINKATTFHLWSPGCGQDEPRVLNDEQTLVPATCWQTKSDLYRRQMQRSVFLAC